MPVSQEKEACWIVEPADGKPDPEGTSHYNTEDGARRAAADEHEPPAPKPAVRQLDAPCWLARCDGDCDDLLEDEENGWYLHAVDRAELGKWLDSYDWTVTDDGSVFCKDDLPEDARPAPLKDWDVPGQLPLIEKREPDAR